MGTIERKMDVCRELADLLATGTDGDMTVHEVRGLLDELHDWTEALLPAARRGEATSEELREVRELISPDLTLDGVGPSPELLRFLHAVRDS